jgi:hypothetical protein
MNPVWNINLSSHGTIFYIYKYMKSREATTKLNYEQFLHRNHLSKGMVFLLRLENDVTIFKAVSILFILHKAVWYTVLLHIKSRKVKLTKLRVIYNTEITLQRSFYCVSKMTSLFSKNCSCFAPIYPTSEGSFPVWLNKRISLTSRVTFISVQVSMLLMNNEVLDLFG